MPATVAGRRERKKEATREALLTTARRLFATQGYAATTVRQISDGADVAERTFFRYFDSKEDLLLPDVEAMFDAITAAVRARPAEEGPLASIFAAASAVWDGGSPLGYLGAGVDQTEPALAGRLVKVFTAWEDGLATALHDRFTAAGTPGSTEDLQLRASVMAQGAASAIRAAMRLVRLPPGTATTRAPAGGAALRAALRSAFAILAAGEPTLAAALGAGERATTPRGLSGRDRGRAPQGR